MASSRLFSRIQRKINNRQRRPIRSDIHSLCTLNIQCRNVIDYVVINDQSRSGDFSICTTPSVGVGRKCVTATSRLGQFWGEQLNNYQNTCIKLTDGDFTFLKNIFSDFF